MSRRWFAAGLVAALSVTLLFLVLPVVAIFVDTGPVDLLSSLGDEGALEALRLSLRLQRRRGGDDRRGRHARRLLPGHPALPRPGDGR